MRKNKFLAKNISRLSVRRMRVCSVFTQITHSNDHCLYNDKHTCSTKIAYI